MGTFQNISQAGNTKLTWTLSGENITNHEAWAFTLENTSPTNGTGALISNVTVFIRPTRYNIDLSVMGPQAIWGHFESNGV
jgi:hypothetical protein